MLERHTRRRNRFAPWLVCGSIFGGSMFTVTFSEGVAWSEEPVRQFVAKLKEDRLFDVALRYLEIEEKKGRLPEEIRSDLPLEKILLMQAALSAPQKPEELQSKIDEVEKAIRDFIVTFNNHPRLPEAKMKLGDVLRDRAGVAIRDSRLPANQGNLSSLREEARGYLSEADSIYGSVITGLTPLLQNLEGNRARTSEDLALREISREQYRQAEMLQAKTFEFMADTYDEGSDDWRRDLAKAESKLTDIIEKASTPKEAGRRVLCQLYRGQVQSKLGKKKEARESFTRVANVNEGGPFALWRNEAITGLIHLDLAESPPKYEAAIIRGHDALKLLNGNERIESTAIAMQLALAEAGVEYSKTLTDAKDNNRQRVAQREARALLQQLLRVHGPHREAALKALTELGGSQSILAKAEELPEAKNFEEALSQARSRIERAETSDQTIPLLTQQASDPAEVDKLKQDIQRDREQAALLLIKSFSLYQESDGREALLSSKYYLAYCYLKLEQYWEAYAVSAAIVESDKTTENGSKAAEFALIALSKIIDATGKEEQVHLIPSLERLAKLLIEIAPGTEGARNAIDVLVTLSVRDKRYEDAERYINMSDGNSASGASFLGQMLWREYQAKLLEHRKNQSQETDEDKSLLQKASSLLETAWANQAAGRNDPIALYTATTLISIYLSKDQIAEALNVLKDPQKGAIAIVDGNPALEAREKLEVYKLQLQSLVQQSAAPNGSPLDASEVQSLVTKMKEISTQDESLFTNALRNLAGAIHSKISETPDVQLQARIGNALGLLVSQLAETSNDIQVLDSAAASVYSLASNLAKVPGLEKQAESLMKVADVVYQKIAARPADELAAANRKPEDLQMRMALAKAGAGQFEAAHRIFSEALAKAPMNVTFQLAAAKNLQDWAAEKDIALLQKAWAGAEPTSTGANAIWGWNKIAQLTASRVNEPTFRDVYFDARYNLAKSRMLIGLAQSDPQARRAELTQANRILLQTRGIHPSFGTPEFQAKFEQLEQQVKNELAK